MKGRVNAYREAIVRVSVYGRRGTRRNISAVIDTGYNGALSLPPDVIRSLGLLRIGNSQGELADGSVVSFDVYAGTIIWAGHRQRIDIDEARTSPLLGMELLDRHEVNIRVEPAGRVNI